MVTRNALAQRRHRERMARLGLCQICSKVPARPDKTTCQGCHDETGERIKERRAAFDELNLCRDCGAEELETLTMCARCAKRARESSRACAARARLRRRVMRVLLVWLFWHRHNNG